jgi:hypothetical protein
VEHPQEDHSRLAGFQGAVDLVGDELVPALE